MKFVKIFFLADVEYSFIKIYAHLLKFKNNIKQYVFGEKK
jgi:hypothetical protein